MVNKLEDQVLSLSDSDRRLLRRHAAWLRLRQNPLLRFVKDLVRGRSQPGTAAAPVPAAAGAPGDLVVIFRHVYISQDVARFPSKARPAGFDHTKCFVNLVETIKLSKHAGRARVVVFYNGTPAEYRRDPLSAYAETCAVPIEVRFLDATSAVEAVLIMFGNVARMPLAPNDIVYFLENDYLHRPEWLDEVYGAFGAGLPFDYLSLYDHPDRYKFPQNYRNSSVLVSGSRHWVTAASTCGTFMTRFDRFIGDFKFIYSTKHDHRMFTRLTKGKGRVLITPVPGLAVHCMTEHFDPIQGIEVFSSEAGK